MIYQGWDWSIVVSQGLYIKINWSIKDKIDLLLSHKGYILRLIDLSRMRMIYCWFTLLNADIFKINWSIKDAIDLSSIHNDCQWKIYHFLLFLSELKRENDINQWK